KVGAVEFHTRQLTFWRLGPDDMDLTVQLDYQVRQGLLFQLPVQLPPGWEVEAVELTPAQRGPSWGVRPQRNGSLLLVDLRRPLRPREQSGSKVLVPAGRLVLRLRPAQARPLTGRDLTFPDPLPMGARLREGGLALGFDARVFRARLNTTSPTG